MYKAVFSLRWRLRGFPAFGPDHWPRTSPDDVVGCLSFDPGKTTENLRERGGHRNQELHRITASRIPEIIQPASWKFCPTIPPWWPWCPVLVSSRTFLRPLLAAPAPRAENLLAAARIQSNHGILWASARRGVPVSWRGSLAQRC